jgi:hypothetical protein
VKQSGLQTTRRKNVENHVIVHSQPGTQADQFQPLEEFAGTEIEPFHQKDRIAGVEQEIHWNAFPT